VATLLVTVEQSEMLALACTQGKLLLTLRRWADQNEIATSGMVPSTMLGSHPKAPEPVKAKTEERRWPGFPARR